MTGKRFRKYFLLLLGLIVTFAGQAARQKKGDVSVGMGLPELSSVRVRYRVYDQFQTGFSIGLLPRSIFDFKNGDKLVSVTGELFYHFGRETMFSDMRLFYFNAGINFIQERPNQWYKNWWNSYLRIGGEIFSASNFGISIDGGFMVNLNQDKNWAQTDWILPSFGVDFYYRF